MSPLVGKYLMLAGAIALVAGAAIYFLGDKLSFLGRLPGDIRVEKEGGSFYFPITTCILISVLVTVIIRVIQWLIR